jgi:hypothetical protein
MVFSVYGDNYYQIVKNQLQSALKVNINDTKKAFQGY